MSIHTCSYYCDRPACVLAQRDELRQAIEQAEKQEPVAFRNTATGAFCTGGFLRKDWVKWQPLYTAPVHASDISAKRVDETPKCKDDPRAPHGFDRNASHNADRYVCECESWEPPEIEPVAWWDKDENRSDEAFRFQPTQNHTQPLYTAPKREWVGLTDEEVIECLDSVALSVVETKKVVTKHLNVYNAAKVIEAKLKEKNT